MATVLESLNDSDSISESQPIKYKHESFNCLNIFFVIFGSVLILIAFIDMIVFYVIPNNKIRENKRNYPNYTFDKPKSAVIVVHFLLHIFLLIVGIMTIFAIFPRIRKSIAFLVIIITCSAITVGLYIFELVLGSFMYDSMPKNDESINQIASLINMDHPIDSAFVYSKGRIHRSKSASKTCYSKGGINIPIDSTLLSQPFSTQNQPSSFVFKIKQNITMTDELTKIENQAKSIIYSCISNYHAEIDYYPYVNEENLINNGQKRPKSLEKKYVIAAVVLGVGVYSELYYKSLPIINYVQDSSAKIVDGVDYNGTFSAIQCSSIGKCDTNNAKPHP